MKNSTSRILSLTQSSEGLNLRLKREITIINPINGEHAMVTAVWDTGVNYSVIDETVIDKLKLSPSGTMPSQSTNADSETRNTYKIQMFLRNDFYFNVNAIGIKSVDVECQALIGMDVICAGDFSITNFEGKTCLSFRVPSQHRIDYENNL
ncbi:MAG TPA: hypothetical protein PLL00_00820 [Bacteroidia bacterium]|nr:hypothetical protein [Bacteroidia bacterium]